MRFNTFDLKMDADIMVMWSIFHNYTTKGSIEVDETLVRSIEDIIR